MTRTEMAQALGRLGGKARSRRLTSAERSRIASLGGLARRQSYQNARRIAANFEYLAAVQALQPPPAVRRERTATGRLPGLYAGKA